MRITNRQNVVFRGLSEGQLPLSSLDPTTVMSAEDCVDASLRGLELGETLTLPSLQDPRLLERAEAAAVELLQVSQTTGRVAARYAPSSA